MSKVLSAKTRYLEKKIREEYTSADVGIWQGLCRQCETEVGDSIDHMYVILDMAKHNDVQPLDIIKCGRVASGQTAVNGRFMECLIKEMYGDEVDNDVKGVLDLTAEEEELSGSYEETDEKYLDAPTSNEAYEIDGFVVPDEEADTGHRCQHGVLLKDDGEACDPCWRASIKAAAAKKANADTPTGAGKVPRDTWKKRNLQTIEE